eukprot:3536093-Pyramimonas_sp.AAC.1
MVTRAVRKQSRSGARARMASESSRRLRGEAGGRGARLLTAGFQGGRWQWGIQGGWPRCCLYRWPCSGRRIGM